MVVVWCSMIQKALGKFVLAQREVFYRQNTEGAFSKMHG